MTNFEILTNTAREDEVKDLYIKELQINLDMRFSIDCYHNNVLFEFKYDENIKNSKVLAQTLYYLNTLLKNGENIPFYVCLINKYEIIVYETCNLSSVYQNDLLFENGCPSSPCNKVIANANTLLNLIYYSITIDNKDDFEEGINVLKNLLKNKKIIAKQIKVTNVRKAFDGYVRQLGDYILKSSNTNGIFEFRADAIGKAKIAGTDLNGDYTINFQFENGTRLIEHISHISYDSFWKRWKRIGSLSEANEVFKSIYDLLGISDRRTKGQFYTPDTLASKSWEMIIKELGDNFWLDGTWRIWDCCAGTGNLEYNIIPESAQKYLYLSTLDIEEVDQLNAKFSLAKKIFQYDFLNDHISKYPNQLKDDIENSNLKWLIFINPPYAESQGVSGIQKGVASSNYYDKMMLYNMGDAARDMFSQFLYRIEEELKDRYFLALFSPKKIISSKKFTNFRDFFRPIFKGGYVVNAKEHFQCPGEFPIIFSLFDRRGNNTFVKEHWNQQNLNYYIYDKKCNIIGQKVISVYDPQKEFRKIFPKDSFQLYTKNMPFLSSAITLSEKTRYNNPLVGDSFMATMQFIASNLQQQDKCFITSGIINNNHNNICITRNNYEGCLIGFALFKSIELNWLNKEDVLLYPNRELTLEEREDCILYALLNRSNQTATYKFNNGEIIRNYLNPLDEELFSFDNCSKIGKKVFEHLKKYLTNDIKYSEIETPFGQGVFLGMHQYQTKTNTHDSQCIGIKISQDFEDDIERLRIKIEQLANDICFY